MEQAGGREQGWARFEVPVLGACWLLGSWAPWRLSGSESAWLAMASWGVAHGLHDLESSSQFVTVAVTCCALLGALLRLGALTIGPRARPHLKRGLQQSGLLASCAPLCVLLPESGAVVYLAALVVVVLVGWRERSRVEWEPLWQRLLRESFPVLAALCFLTMSWQYNAQWLLRGLLIAAGVALVARAAIPVRSVPAP